MSATWANLPEMRDQIPASVQEELIEAFRIGYDLGKIDGRQEAEGERSGGRQIDDGAVIARALSRHRHES